MTNRIECGCIVIKRKQWLTLSGKWSHWHEIGYCPLHLTATRLLEALEEAHKLLLEQDIIMTGNEALLREARDGGPCR